MEQKIEANISNTELFQSKANIYCLPKIKHTPPALPYKCDKKARRYYILQFELLIYIKRPWDIKMRIET